MSFSSGFQKTAVSQKLMLRARKLADKARKIVVRVADEEGNFPGPLAGKFSAQSEIFARASRLKGKRLPRKEELSIRRALRKKQENKPYSGSYFKRAFKDILTKLPVKAQKVIDESKTSRNATEGARRLFNRRHSNLVDWS